MKIVLLTLLLVFTDYSFGMVELGVYDGPKNPSANCSMSVEFEESTSRILLQLTNKVNGTYCPSTKAITLNCDVLNKQCEGTTDTNNRVWVFVHNSKSITIDSTENKWFYGNLVWSAAQTPNPTKYRSKVSSKWMWGSDFDRGICKIPPYNAELKCSLIPIEIVHDICPTLKETAETNALSQCEGVNAAHCHVTFSKENIFLKRALINPGGFNARYETGCEWTATAELK